jgi:hypothetical protein
MSVLDRCTFWDERTIGSDAILRTPMELLGELGQIEARFGSFGDSANLHARQGHGLR